MPSMGYPIMAGVSYPMSNLKKWRNWCVKIENEILIPYKFDKLVAEEYFEIIKPTLDAGEPAEFHNWCSNNYGLSLAFVIRKLTDDDKRVYSIRRLVGDIQAHNKDIKKATYIRRYPEHLRYLAERNWNNNISENKQFLPKGVPAKHLEEIQNISSRINGITNSFLAHRERTKNTKYTIEFDEMYLIIKQLISIAYFYSDLIGGSIPDDDSNVVLAYDWQSIFKKPWLSS
jgi:hypothetical protein